MKEGQDLSTIKNGLYMLALEVQQVLNSSLPSFMQCVATFGQEETLPY